MRHIDLVWKHLEKKGSITAVEAFGEYGIMRLAARIKDLRDAGKKINTITTEAYNRWGNRVQFATYIKG